MITTLHSMQESSRTLVQEKHHRRHEEGAVGALLTHCTIEVVRTNSPGETPVI